MASRKARAIAAGKESAESRKVHRPCRDPRAIRIEPQICREVPTDREDVLFIVGGRELQADPLLLIAQVRLQATQGKFAVSEVPAGNRPDDPGATRGPGHSTPEIEKPLQGGLHLDDPGQPAEAQPLDVQLEIPFPSPLQREEPVCPDSHEAGPRPDELEITDPVPIGVPGEGGRTSEVPLRRIELEGELVQVHRPAP